MIQQFEKNSQDCFHTETDRHCEEGRAQRNNLACLLEIASPRLGATRNDGNFAYKKGFDGALARPNPCLSRFALPGGSFAFVLLYLTADIFHCALAALAGIFVHGLATVTSSFINLFALLSDIGISFGTSFT